MKTRKVSMFLFLVVLLMVSMLPIIQADVNDDNFPRLDDIYFTVVYPESTAMFFARTCQLDTVRGMIDSDNVDELAADMTGILRPHDPNVTEWTPVGDTNNWKCVDEVGCDKDDTYVKSIADLDQDAYGLEDPTVADKAIQSVIVYGYAKYIPENLTLKVVIGGVSYYGAASHALTTSYVAS